MSLLLSTRRYAAFRNNRLQKSQQPILTFLFRLRDLCDLGGEKPIEEKFAVARTSSPARENARAPQNSVERTDATPYALVRNWSSLFLNRMLNVVSEP
jgi:hypothetical protein